MKFSKAAAIVVLGNILEYYDFLLFAHIGFLITPLFFPNLSASQTHILSLLLFGLSFVTRPIGGYIFGKISDKNGRKTALIQSVKWAVFPAVGFALLPEYATLGIFSSILFVGLRLLQGIALGGEYPVAGTYLMEMNKEKQGLFSSILVASGSIGSIIGLGFAVLCFQETSPKWLWRIAFLVGGVGSIVSYFMRKYIKEIIEIKKSDEKISQLTERRVLVFIISVIAGLTMWIPMTYSNFYITKILHLSSSNGLYASLVALIAYLIILPFVGMIFDRSEARKYMIISILLVCPLSLLAIYLLSLQYIAIAQILLIVSAAFVGAPIHKLLNDIFPIHLRGRNVNFLFMLGLSFGGLLPSLSSYVVDKTGFYLAPAVLLSLVAIIVLFIYKNINLNSENI